MNLASSYFMSQKESTLMRGRPCCSTNRHSYMGSTNRQSLIGSNVRFASALKQLGFPVVTKCFHIQRKLDTFESKELGQNAKTRWIAQWG